MFRAAMVVSGDTSLSMLGLSLVGTHTPHLLAGAILG